MQPCLLRYTVWRIKLFKTYTWRFIYYYLTEELQIIPWEENNLTFGNNIKKTVKSLNPGVIFRATFTRTIILKPT